MHCRIQYVQTHIPVGSKKHVHLLFTSSSSRGLSVKWPFALLSLDPDWLPMEQYGLILVPLCTERIPLETSAAWKQRPHPAKNVFNTGEGDKSCLLQKGLCDTSCLGTYCGGTVTNNIRCKPIHYCRGCWGAVLSSENNSQMIKVVFRPSLWRRLL